MYCELDENYEWEKTEVVGETHMMERSGRVASVNIGLRSLSHFKLRVWVETRAQAFKHKNSESTAMSHSIYLRCCVPFHGCAGISQPILKPNPNACDVFK